MSKEHNEKAIAVLRRAHELAEDGSIMPVRVASFELGVFRSIPWEVARIAVGEAAAARGITGKPDRDLLPDIIVEAIAIVQAAIDKPGDDG